MAGESFKEQDEVAVYSFGQNSYGELGHSDTITRYVPTKIEFCKGKNVVDITCGNEHTAILCDNGDVYSCGYNDSGQCGLGTTQRVMSLEVIPTLLGKNIVKLIAGNGCEHVAALTENGDLYTFGYNARGQLGHNVTTPLLLPTLVQPLVGKSIIKVACSYFHTLVATEDNEIYAFGRNDFGQLGCNDGLDKHTPYRIPFFDGKKVIALACGQYHSCVSLGSGGVYVFGKNDHGQLGIESPGAKNKPMLISGPLSSTVVVQLACGYYHTVALTENGQIYTFGRNDYGQLGLGHTKSTWQPTLVPALTEFRIVEIACGCYHTLALSDIGYVYPFGRNNHGQLGTENTLDSTIPTYIEHLRGIKVRKIAAGFYHSVCLTGNPLAQAQAPKVRNSLSLDLRAMLNNPARSDVHFIVENNIIYAHRCIIMARCEPLEIMLNGPMCESKDLEIVIPEISHEVFLAMLEYIYTDRVVVIESNNIDVEFVLDVLSLADQYLLENLKLICERAIQNSIVINAQNFAVMLKTAHYRQAKSLKKRCIDYIMANFGDIIARPQFLELPPDLMQEVLISASRRGVTINNSF